MKSDSFSDKQYPTAESVLDEIGEKSVRAFALSVQRARADLRKYRKTFPEFVAEHGERGLANWISDRLWSQLSKLAESNPDMTLIEKGVTREIVIGLNYKFRVKRHDEEGNISSYETQTFLDFVVQDGTQHLEGMEEIRLVAGYEWLKDIRDVGRPVVSLRDGRENVIWREYLDEAAEGEGEPTAPVVTPEQLTPSAPTIEVSDELGKRAKEQSEKQ